MIDQYVSNIKKLRAIGFDVGEKDVLLATNKELNRILTQYEIPHSFETHDGDHTNRMAARVETKVLPFFSRNLSFSTAKQADRKE